MPNSGSVASRSKWAARTIGRAELEHLIMNGRAVQAGPSEEFPAGVAGILLTEEEFEGFLLIAEELLRVRRAVLGTS